jgi:hypothetical protein
MRTAQVNRWLVPDAAQEVSDNGMGSFGGDVAREDWDDFGEIGEIVGPRRALIANALRCNSGTLISFSLFR